MKVFMVEPENIMEFIRDRERECIAKLLEEKYPNEEFEFIDSRGIEKENKKENPLWRKGLILQLLSTADIVVFNVADDLKNRFEALACYEYNIMTFDYIDLFTKKLIDREGKVNRGAFK